jgi:hypothetical protein
MANHLTLLSLGREGVIQQQHFRHPPLLRRFIKRGVGTSRAITNPSELVVSVGCVDHDDGNTSEAPLDDTPPNQTPGAR